MGAFLGCIASAPAGLGFRGEAYSSKSPTRLKKNTMP